MRANRAISVSRWLFAVGVSILIHAAMVGGWFTVSPTGGETADAHDTRVETPDDGRCTTINLVDAPPRILHTTVRSTPMPTPVTPPALLPKTLVADVGANPAITPAGNSHGGDDPSPPAVALHGRAKAGKTVVYLVDCSSSMGTALSHAKAVVRASLKLVGPDAKFLVVAYNGGATGCFPAAAVADGEHVAAAERWLNELTAEGRSDHLCGFREALAAKPDAIFLLTDADDLDEKETKTLTAITPAGVFVTAAIFGKPPAVVGTSPLEQFTRRRNGSVRWYLGP